MSDYRPHSMEIEQGLLPYERLANGIIIQACSDYRTCYMRDKRRKAIGYLISRKPVSSSGVPENVTVTEIETFFRSQWFHQLSGIDPEYLIEQLRKEIDRK